MRMGGGGEESPRLPFLPPCFPRPTTPYLPGPTKGGPPTMGGTTVAAAAARASRVCWTCWYVLVAIIGRITGAAGTCIASTVGTVGTAGTAVGIPVTGAPRTSCSNLGRQDRHHSSGPCTNSETVGISRQRLHHCQPLLLNPRPHNSESPISPRQNYISSLSWPGGSRARRL